MPKVTNLSKNNNQNKTSLSFDIALDTFRESGHFTLTNAILNSELVYFGEYLQKQSNSNPDQNYKFYLNNVTFIVDDPTLYPQNDTREYADEAVLWQLQQIFKFSAKWGAIALHNVIILQGENHYPLSPYFIYRLLSDLVAMQDYLTELSITKAEFHPWAWIRFLKKSPKLEILTLDLCNEDKDDNLMVFCEALQYAKIKTLNLGDTEISVEGYRALNELLDKNYFIEKMLLTEPTDSESLAIFKKINDRLVYLDYEKYLEGRLPVCALDLNKLVDNETRTLGHLLLENALKRDDTLIMGCLIEAGANLFEQRGDEKPFLMQAFEKNREFKILILEHIIYDKTFEKTVERVLRACPDSKEIIIKMGRSVTQYARILRRRVVSPYLFESLLSLLKDAVRLSRPSKQRDKEFIEIYFRLFKCLIFFQDAEGRVTVESISNAQSMLDEIRAISINAELGLTDGSKLHYGLREWSYILREDMERIKKLTEKDDVIYEKDKVIEQKDNTIKNLTEQCECLEAKNQQKQVETDTKIQQIQANAEVECQQFKKDLQAQHKQNQADVETERQQLKAEITRLEAALKETMKLVKVAPEKNASSEEPGSSTRFFPRR